MKKLLATIGIACFALTATVCHAQAPAAPAAPAKADKVGATVPAWEATELEGDKKFSSASLAGKPYAIVFVNSACSSCRAEMAAIRDMDFGGKLTVLLASVDVRAKGVMATYKDKLKLDFPIMDDAQFVLAKKFGLGYTPATVIVDAGGKVEAIFSGYMEENRDALIKAFLKYKK